MDQEMKMTASENEEVPAGKHAEVAGYEGPQPSYPLRSVAVKRGSCCSFG